MEKYFKRYIFEINSCSLFKWKENTAKVAKHNIIFHVDLKLLEIFFLCIIHLAYYYFIGALNDAQNADIMGEMNGTYEVFNVLTPSPSLSSSVSFSPCSLLHLLAKFNQLKIYVLFLQWPFFDLQPFITRHFTREWW